MRIKSIFWYSVTLIISILLAPIPSYAESVSLPEDTDSNSTNTDTTIYTEYTSTEDTSFTMNTTEITSSTLESVTETTTITTLETTTLDTTTYQDTTLESTTLDTTTLDTAPYIEENISVVTPPSNEVHNTTLSEIVSTSNKESVASVSSIRATVLTVSNTNIQKTDESPETKHATVLVPILLLMAGALFTGATSKPKN